MSRQTISIVVRRTIRYAGIGSLSLQTLGCADELISIINDLRNKKPISTVYLAQFGAQLFFLAFSYKNFKLTEKLTEFSGSRNPKSIRKILRQHNSDGSFKYLFAGADFMDKNIQGLANPMMMKLVFESCLNVAEKVKIECEKAFQVRIKLLFLHIDETFTVDILKMKPLMHTLLKRLNLKSLENLLLLTNGFIRRMNQQNHVTKKLEHAVSYDYFLKTVYMAINRNTDGNMNVFISSLVSSTTLDSLDGISSVRVSIENEIISEFDSNRTDLSEEFDNKFKREAESDIDLGRKIYLIIQDHSDKFVDELKHFPSSAKVNMEHLFEAIENILKRLTIEAATLFFGIVKSILVECVLQLPMPELIRAIFQKLVKHCNGNLTAMEKEIKAILNDKRKRDKFEKDFLDALVSKKELELRHCSVCNGQGFV